MRVAAVEESNRSILAQHPPTEVAAEIRRRLAVVERQASAAPSVKRGASRGWAWGGLATGGLALAALLLVVRPGAREGQPVATYGIPAGGEPGEKTDIKGPQQTAKLAIYRKGSDGPDRLAPGTKVRAGDVLQLAYVSSGRAFGVVASVDARGTITWHLPEGEGTASPLAPRGETHLPHAYRLDDSPGFERFVLVTSDQAFSTEAVRELLLAPGKTPPAGLTVTEHTLSKETQ